LAERSVHVNSDQFVMVSGTSRLRLADVRTVLTGGPDHLRPGRLGIDRMIFLHALIYGVIKPWRNHAVKSRLLAGPGTGPGQADRARYLEERLAACGEAARLGVPLAGYLFTRDLHRN
jgi:hypothetical protein